MRHCGEKQAGQLHRTIIFDLLVKYPEGMSKNGHHFPDDIFKCILFNENVWIWIKISLKFVPGGPNNIFLALV